MKALKISLAFLALSIFLSSGMSLGEKVVPPKEADKIQQSRYLPLAQGNYWLYRRTIFEGQKVYSWEFYGKTEDNTKSFVKFTQGDDFRPGVSKESYLVTDKIMEDGRERWKIKVSSPNARDGRYGSLLHVDPDTILWGRMVSSAAIIEISEVSIINSYFEGELRQERALLVEPLNPKAQVTLQHGAYSKEDGVFQGPPVQYTCPLQRTNVEVPAGRFKDCLQLVTKIVSTEKNQGDDWQWSTQSFYALGVGLVKEVQNDSKGKPTYVLELMNYKVK